MQSINKEISRGTEKSATAPVFNCPAVSVIVPMYNAERYIGECLDSILAQTFPNFEVIVVDDCSTDSSCAVVESYAEKFNGRLALKSLRKNSGSGAMPRNKGLEFSRGEYVFFMDADDLLTENALEKMYTLAKEYDADLIYCEKCYEMENDGTRIVMVPDTDFDDKPVWDTNNIWERVQRIGQIMPWRRFTRRDLLIEHEITFPHCKISEDDIWTYGVIFYAKKSLRVSEAFYIRRNAEDSVMRKNRTLEQVINFWLSPILFGVKHLDEFMRRHEFFKTNPQYRYAILEAFICSRWTFLFKDSFKLSSVEFYTAIRQEYGDKFGEYGVIIPALCTILNTQQKINCINQQNYQQFAAQAQARVDELQKIALADKAYITELENFILNSQQRIAELEAENNRLKAKEK